MSRGRRIGLTIAVSGVLLLVSLGCLAVAGLIRAAGAGAEECIVPDVDPDNGCLDDQLTGRATATVLDVDELVDDSGPPVGAVTDWPKYTVDVDFRAPGEHAVTQVDVFDGGEVPAEGDKVQVAYQADDPEATAALVAELDRLHRPGAPVAAVPDVTGQLVTGAVTGVLAVLLAVAGGIWSARGRPRPRPEASYPAWSYGLPPGYLPGYGPPPGYRPPPGSGWPAAPQPPGPQPPEEQPPTWNNPG